MALLAEAAPLDAINLGMGEPLDAMPAGVTARLQSVMAAENTTYGPPTGLLQFGEAVARRYHGRVRQPVRSGNVLATTGVTHAVFVALAGILGGRGGRVIHPDPGYVLYEPAVRMCGGTPVPLSLDRRRDFALDLDGLRALLEEPAGALIVNSPGNPTGRVADRHTLREVARLCAEHEVPIISDEIYEHLVFDGTHASVAEYSDNVLICSGFSKLFKMTGYRIGWCVVPDHYYPAVVAAHQYSVFRAPMIGQHATLAMFDSQDEIQNLVATTREKRDLVVRALRQLTDLRFSVPEAGMFVYVDVSHYGSDWDVALDLAEEGVITTPSVGPGVGFGQNGRGYLRISFAAEHEQVRAGMEKLVSVLLRRSAG